MNETDVMPSVRSERLVGVKVHAVVIGADSYIPLTEIRNKVLFKSSARIYQKCTQMNLKSIITCPSLHFKHLQKLGVVEFNAKTCRMISKLEAEVLIRSFRDHNVITSMASRLQLQKQQDQTHDGAPAVDPRVKAARSTRPPDSLGSGQLLPESVGLRDDVLRIPAPAAATAVTSSTFKYCSPSLNLLTLPVQSCGDDGEQNGTFVAKFYISGSASTCISCDDCGTFFSPAAFATHWHDKQGRSLATKAGVLKLATDNPTTEQRQMWLRFQLQRKRPTSCSPIGGLPAEGFLPMKCMSMDLSGDAVEGSPCKVSRPCSPPVSSQGSVRDTALERSQGPLGTHVVRNRSIRNKLLCDFGLEVVKHHLLEERKPEPVTDSPSGSFTADSKSNEEANCAEKSNSREEFGSSWKEDARDQMTAVISDLPLPDSDSKDWMCPSKSAMLPRRCASTGNIAAIYPTENHGNAIFVDTEFSHLGKQPHPKCNSSFSSKLAASSRPCLVKSANTVVKGGIQLHRNGSAECSVNADTYRGELGQVNRETGESKHVMAGVSHYTGEKNVEIPTPDEHVNEHEEQSATAHTATSCKVGLGEFNTTNATVLSRTPGRCHTEGGTDVTDDPINLLKAAHTLLGIAITQLQEAKEWKTMYEKERWLRIQAEKKSEIKVTEDVYTAHEIHKQIH
ncbi:uncharacterized protein LOC116940502 isoform X2 [Petromyzon marinus]|uniref:uncharacterized protein LOC116940502 isoform X2 n=1 Tax=Petromyzon marinus TaxID=7757 RepID=UPI003F6F3CD3